MNEAEREVRHRFSPVVADMDIAVTYRRDEIHAAVGPDGIVDSEALHEIFSGLLEDKPFLRAPKGSLGTDVPSGPTAPRVGSGRRRYGPPVLNEQRLRDKYPALNA